MPTYITGNLDNSNSQRSLYVGMLKGSKEESQKHFSKDPSNEVYSALICLKDIKICSILEKKIKIKLPKKASPSYPPHHQIRPSRSASQKHEKLGQTVNTVHLLSSISQHAGSNLLSPPPCIGNSDSIQLILMPVNIVRSKNSSKFGRISLYTGTGSS